MSIDRESDGLPHMNPHKRTTKVNISVVVAVVFFLAAMFGVVWWLATSRG